jgi:hypothetical protein
MAGRLERITSPKGIAMYPWLTRQDTKWSPDGVYKISLSVPSDDKEVQEFCDKVREKFTDEFGNKKIAKAIFPFKEDEEGNTIITFKSKNLPRLFNSKGQPIKNTDDLKIGGGSIVKVNASINPYDKGINTGVALYLNAVQIIELVEFGNKSLFGDEGEGFAVEDDVDSTPTKKEVLNEGEEAEF